MRTKLPMLMALAGGLIAGGGAVALADQQGGNLSQTQLEQAIRNYLLEHPEVIPEAMKRLQERETATLVDDNRAAIEKPFAGAWAGPADAKQTLVMFTDYSCGYCRASVADVDRLLAEDKQLKIVWREIPILGPDSDIAARAALQAAGQGRYLAFHRRMFAGGPADAAHISRVSKETGVVLTSKSDPAIEKEIEANIALAHRLGITGTPTFIIGDKMMQGAVGYDALKEAVADARKPAA